MTHQQSPAAHNIISRLRETSESIACALRDVAGAEYRTTKNAKMGDLGSKVLKKMPTGVVWKAGALAEVSFYIKTNHGGCIFTLKNVDSSIENRGFPLANHDSSLENHDFYDSGYQFRLCPLEEELTEACFQACRQ